MNNDTTNSKYYKRRRTFLEAIQATGIPTDGLTLEAWGKLAYAAAKTAETK